jgi:hypothetical protein
VTSQQSADRDLLIWQANRELSPERRIEMLLFDFWLPPVAVQDARFEEAMKVVEREMSA